MRTILRVDQAAGRGAAGGPKGFSGARRFAAGVLLLLLTGVAAAFPVELEVAAPGLDVVATGQSANDLAVVRAVNHESFAVRCMALFRNGPERQRSRRVTIQPGASVALSWAPRRSVVRMRIELQCEAARPAD